MPFVDIQSRRAAAEHFYLYESSHFNYLTAASAGQDFWSPASTHFVLSCAELLDKLSAQQLVISEKGIHVHLILDVS